MLLPNAPSGEEIANAIGKAVRILDGDMFRDARWFQMIAAFKQFDELASAEQVN